MSMYNFQGDNLRQGGGHFKQDKTLLVGAGVEAAPALFTAKGYAYFCKICCRECAIAYIKRNIGESRKYVILSQEDYMFNNTELVAPMPVLWRGNPEEIINTFKGFGFDVYYSGKETEAIVILPRFFEL